jgi:adenylate kinase
MRIIVTGVPGTGKTTLAKALSERLDIPLVNIRDFVTEKKIGQFLEGEVEVEIPVLKKELMKSLGVEYIIEGHLACEIKVPIDFVFVLRLNPKVLAERLKNREYSEEKVKDNLECEAIDYCGVNAKERYGDKVWEIDGFASLSKQIQTVLDIIEGKKKEKDEFDFLSIFDRPAPFEKLHQKGHLR